MANITPFSGWQEGIYQLETTDPVQGGPTGKSNQQARGLLANEIYLKGEIENTDGRTIRNVRSLTSTDPITFSSVLNGSVIHYLGSSDQFHLIDLTGDTDFPEVPTEGIAAGRIGWMKFVYVGGLVINKPIGMVMYVNGADILTGSGTDTAQAATVWAVSGSSVEIYVKDNVALVYVTLPLPSPAFKTGMMVHCGAAGQVISTVIDTTWWIHCDGSAISRTTYAELFAVIGTAFGAGDGSTTFNLPNDTELMIRHRD